jgi:hypothetical protein
MAKGGPEWIEPTEALRIVIRAAIPHNPAVAEPIVSGWWFSYRKSAVDAGICTEAELEAAGQALGRFDQGRKAGKIRATGIDADGQRGPIDPADFARGFFNIRRGELDTSLARMRRVWMDVLVSRKNVEALAKGDSKGRGGRPPAADWEAVKDALRIKINECGFPERGSIGWQTRADVERWVQDLLERRHEPAEMSTIKDHVPIMLDELRDEFARTET